MDHREGPYKRFGDCRGLDNWYLDCGASRPRSYSLSVLPDTRHNLWSATNESLARPVCKNDAGFGVRCQKRSLVSSKWLWLVIMLLVMSLGMLGLSTLRGRQVKTAKSVQPVQQPEHLPQEEVVTQDEILPETHSADQHQGNSHWLHEEGPSSHPPDDQPPNEVVNVWHGDRGADEDGDGTPSTLQQDTKVHPSEDEEWADDKEHLQHVDNQRQHEDSPHPDPSSLQYPHSAIRSHNYYDPRLQQFQINHKARNAHPQQFFSDPWKDRHSRSALDSNSFSWINKADTIHVADVSAHGFWMDRHPRHDLNLDRHRRNVLGLDRRPQPRHNLDLDRRPQPRYDPDWDRHHRRNLDLDRRPRYDPQTFWAIEDERKVSDYIGHGSQRDSSFWVDQPARYERQDNRFAAVLH